MSKVKVFDAAAPEHFEGLINNFIEENFIEVVDIKYDYFQYGGRMHFYAMVLYKENENGG